MKLITTWRKLTFLDEHHLNMVKPLVQKNITAKKYYCFPYWATLINKGIFFYDKRFIR